jgi:Tfp pilus assembly protein PilX
MSNNKTSNIKLRAEQAGVVSLLVTMVLMIVISLIALGFAQVARNNQSQQLDQQLSTQAFYAAESGVNDAAKIVAANIQNLPANQISKTSCANQGIYANLSPDLNASGTVSYSCILVNPYPPNLQTDVGSTSTIIPVSAASGSIGDINLTWSAQGLSGRLTGCPTSKSLPSSWGSCGVGVLRIDLVPTDNAPNNAASMAEETMTSFIVPMESGSGGGVTKINYTGANASTSNADNIVGVDCSAVAPSCSIQIDTAAAPHTSYDMRVISEYQDSSLQITADDTSGNPVQLSGAQVVIDSTGKAQNVLRRIQVYVPIGVAQNQLSDYAIESTDSICKRFAVMSNYYVGTELDDLNVNENNPSLDLLCQ